MKTKLESSNLAKTLNISQARSLEATIKAKLIYGVIKEITKSKITHQELAKKSKLSRSTVTGILSGSLQKITIDRVLKLVDAAGLTAEVKIKKIA